jgi:transcriptional regulator with PAS, ATPase and Fis domain
MAYSAWIEESPVAVTVCDTNGIVLDMNRKSEKTFQSDGGRALIGKSLLDCHSPASREMIRKMLQNGASNTYTIEKAGVKKLIHQMPWFENGAVAGLVEFSIEIPAIMPHFNRDLPSTPKA